MASEIELKLLLPPDRAEHVRRALAQVEVLDPSKARQRWLINRYYDTPDFLLQRQRSALRLRHVSESPTDASSAGEWLQTFKTAGVSQGGLSQRGEWEHKVPCGALDAHLLQDTPWAAMDPRGDAFRRLQVCFETRCQRTTWHVHTAEGHHIEVALDVGEIVAGERHQPMLELELELLAGPPEALFQWARMLVQHTGGLPFDMSKAERGHALACDQANAPTRARPVRLSSEMQPRQAAQATMAEMLDQFTRNLAGLVHGHDDELVHQARIGWRRWRSAERLFRPWLPVRPDHNLLRPLWRALGQLRELDVCALETLPTWAEAYRTAFPEHAADMATAQAQLTQARNAQYQHVLAMLATPDTGLALLHLTQWLHGLAAPVAHHARPEHDRHWARARMNKLQRRLQHSLDAPTDPAPEADHDPSHQTRLLAKRTRYSLETLHGLLPPHKTKRWIKQANRLQTELGQSRDLLQTIQVLQALPVSDRLVAFLHGVAVGQTVR